MEEYLTKLVPVSEWEFYLYRVEYFRTEADTTPCATKYLVSTDTHIHGEAQEYAPHSFWSRYMEHEVARVSRPQAVGSLYGHRIDETAIAAGEREARARKLIV